jgi:hypothetical protein
VGYQNASLYKIDHPCRVSLPATVSDRVGAMRAWASLANSKRFLTSGLFANGASLSIIFGHRGSTIPRAFFLLDGALMRLTPSTVSCAYLALNGKDGICSNPACPASFLLSFHYLDRSFVSPAIFVSKLFPRFVSKFCSRRVREAMRVALASC